MKKIKKTVVWPLAGLLAMLGLTSCGSFKKNAGGSPAKNKPIQIGDVLETRFVGHQEQRVVTGYHLSPATPVGDLVGTGNFLILKDQKGNLYNFVRGVITPRATPVYVWRRGRRVGKVSPPKKPVLKTSPKPTLKEGASSVSKNVTISTIVKPVVAKKSLVDNTQPSVRVSSSSYMSPEDVEKQKLKKPQYK